MDGKLKFINRLSKIKNVKYSGLNGERAGIIIIKRKWKIKKKKFVVNGKKYFLLKMMIILLFMNKYLKSHFF